MSPERRVLRLYGVSESAVAEALAAAGGDGDGVEATICARDFEVHVDLVVEPGAESRAAALETALVEPLEEYRIRTGRGPGRGDRPLAFAVSEASRSRQPSRAPEGSSRRD